MTPRIRNPVLPGFHPDPSFLRHGDDYYIATSTFEWFPGVAIHHSRDLVHWRSIGHALTRPSQLDLRGVPDSGGIWAPSLSHHQGKFWLVYTVMRTRTGPYKDMVNFLVTADQIEGPWSEPIFLNARGFDPSFFHDEDGSSWLVQIRWDHRQGHPSFAGIVIQPYDASSGQLVGKAEVIFQKERLIEGPNIYRKNGYYYLMLAEGGTSWHHAVSLARSRKLLGPYEADPTGMVLTSSERPELALQKAGHGEVVETPEGEWYLAHLASRPLDTPLGPRCPLGRETCIQKVTWTQDGWLRLADGGNSPAIEVESPLQIPAHPWPSSPSSFPRSIQGPEWQSLREPREPWMDLDSRPGWLRIRGGESPASVHQQSLVAQRVTSLEFHAEVLLDFKPDNFQQMAGLICYYDTKTHLYLRLTRNDDGQRVLGITTMKDGSYEEFTDVTLETEGPIRLGMNWKQERLHFLYAPPGEKWRSMEPELDASVLSDDFGKGLHFTGAFVGICVQDLDYHTATADFSEFLISPTLLR
jgi:xylan 1,4-beta-xylosidase